jgi:hypothetical protein
VSYGCFDRAPYLTSMPVADGHFMDGYTRTPRMVAMPFRMSKDCNYTTTELGQKDEKCHGCKWKAGAGTGVATGPMPLGDGVAGVREMEGESSGDQGPGDVERASAVAEQRSALEKTWPGAALYQPTEENK